MHAVEKQGDEALKTRVIIAPSNGELTNRVFYRYNVWVPAMLVYPHLGSSQAWLSALTSLYDYEDRLFWKNGARYTVPDIAMLFGDHGDRWIRNFLQSDETASAPRHYSKMFERLRLVNVYCRLARQEGWLED